MIRMIPIVVVSFMLLTVACTSQNTSESTTTPEAPTPLAATGKAFVVGDVGSSADELIPLWQPLASYLAANLEGYSHGTVAVAPDLETMASLLASGEVDLYLDSSYPSIIVSQQSGAPILIRQWRYGAAEYHTVFFAPADSGFTSVSDLVGRTVAFDKPISTSGYFLPAHYLLSEGYNLTLLTSADAAVPADTIGYVFSNEDVNTINWVITGRVDAGVTNSVSYAQIPQETRDAFVVLGETETFPPQLVLVRPDMDEALVSQVIALLTAMDDNEAGQAVLADIETTQFDEVPQGVDSFTERVNAMLELVEGR